MGPSSDFTSSDYPFRTTCCKDDDSWHVIEENLIIDPPVEDLNKSSDVHQVIATVLSKEPLDVRNQVDDSEGDKGDDGEVEVINPMTGGIERIKANDPSFYSADGFKARRYKNSSKPENIPPFIWKSMSLKERRNAIAEEQKRLALYKG